MAEDGVHGVGARRHPQVPPAVVAQGRLRDQASVVRIGLRVRDGVDGVVGLGPRHLVHDRTI